MNLQITRLQPQKRKKGRFNLFTEDGFLTSLSYETILKFGIRENGCIESERLEQAKQDDTVKYAKEQAMQYVAYAPRSSSQVRKRLQQKGVDAQSIDCALETMRRYGYIDDAAYIREFVRSYSAKLGEQAIRQKLLQNGVAGSLIDEVLELPEQTQLEAARAMAIRCFWPPESCEGYASARSGRPTTCSSSCARFSIFSLGQPAISIG